MRILHMSDTHLGFSAYSKIDPDEGINQREADFYHAFKEAVDKAIELRPDLVIHAGDLFDTVRPQNRAIDFALRQMIRLSEEGLETVLISGNHSTPRIRETGSIFRIFEHLPHIHAFHEPGVAKLAVGDATVHAVPHSMTPALHEVVSEARPTAETAYNVLVLHAGVPWTGTYRMDEFNEQEVPMSAVDEGFDYVALGHFHKFTELRKGACYSGSTERLGFGEAGQAKGVVEVDLGSGGLRFHELKSRDMLDMEPLDASGLTSSEIMRETRDRLSSARVDDVIVRLVLKNVMPDAYRSLEVPAIRRLASSAAHFKLDVERVEEEGRKTAGDAHIGSLAHEYQLYVSSLDIPEEKRRRLAEMGLRYFAEGQE